MEMLNVLEINDVVDTTDTEHLECFREYISRALGYLISARNEFEEIKWDKPDSKIVQSTYQTLEEFIVGFHGYKQSKAIPNPISQSCQHSED